MAKLVKVTYGFVEAVNTTDGNLYSSDDFRSGYYDAPGMLAIFESECKNPGKHFVYFFPLEQNNLMQRYLRTSIGDLTQNDTTMTVSTKNSIYKFRIEEDCMPGDQKTVIQINAGEILFGRN